MFDKLSNLVEKLNSNTLDIKNYKSFVEARKLLQQVKQEAQNLRVSILKAYKEQKTEEITPDMPENAPEAEQNASESV